VTGLTNAQLLFMLRGFGWTIALSLLAFAGGGLLGFALALARVYAPRPVRAMAMLYIKLIQGTPLLILLFLTYFGLPAMGLVVDPLVAVALGLSTYASAYLGEIWRGSLEAVPRAQEEAGRRNLTITPNAAPCPTCPAADPIAAPASAPSAVPTAAVPTAA